MRRSLFAISLSAAFASMTVASSDERLEGQRIATDNQLVETYNKIAAWNDVYRISSSDKQLLVKANVSFHHSVLESNLTEGYLLAKLSQEEVQTLKSYKLKVTPDPTWHERTKQWINQYQKSAAQTKAQTKAQQATNNTTIPGYSCYPTVESTLAFAQQATVDYPNLASVEDIGDSWKKTQDDGGFDLLVLKLTNQAITGDKPILFINSAIHAREYATAPLNQAFANMLLEGYGTDADITWILDHHDIRLLLQANPDGRKQAETGKYWRKNANSSYCSGDSIGADLNRNFSLRWGLDDSGSSPNQCNDTYRGPSPASEPEVNSIEQYLRSIYVDKRGESESDAAPADTSGMHIDIHSYSQLMLWPWGHTTTKAPNGDALEILGRKLAYFNDYYPTQSVGLYPTNGTSDEISYGELGIANFTFELGTAFFQSCGIYESTVKPDNLNALLYAARVVSAPYMLPFGPDVSEFTINGRSSDIYIDLDSTFLLDARVTETNINNQNNGNIAKQPIKQVVYYIDKAPWEEGAVGVQLSAYDGDFDETTERVSVEISAQGWALGQHTIYMHSQDTDDNWGPVYAKFIEITAPNAAPTATYTYSCDVQGLCDFDAALSSDSDGTINSYHWDFGNSRESSIVAPSHQFDAAGNYDVTLTVTDDMGKSASNTQTVVLELVNVAPVALFNASCEHLVCSFDGSISTDDTGDIVSYQWSFGDGSTATGAQATHTFSTAGTYTVSLVVTDEYAIQGGRTSALTVKAKKSSGSLGWFSLIYLGLLAGIRRRKN
jgi:carboxypeptidase T